jgi:hypothetical protein
LRKFSDLNRLGVLGWRKAGGRKVLLTMFARQVFPSGAPFERFH